MRSQTDFRRTKRLDSEAKCGVQPCPLPANVAEGHERRSSGEFMQFLGHAKGSLAELETQAIIAGQLELLARTTVEELTDAIAEVSRLLNGLLKAIRRRASE
ncbi:MAG: four helix bundle protein [Pirellulales bacterium]